MLMVEELKRISPTVIDAYKDRTLAKELVEGVLNLYGIHSPPLAA